MRPRTLLPWFLLVCLFLSACAGFSPSGKQQQAALDNFMYALRWQLHPEAAAYFTREHGAAFLARMEQLKDLNVTEVRLRRIEFKNEGRHVDALLEMDYYLLPSTTLKTLRIEQTWHYFAPGGAASGYLITTPFPEFP